MQEIEQGQNRSAGSRTRDRNRQREVKDVGVRCESTRRCGCHSHPPGQRERSSAAPGSESEAGHRLDLDRAACVALEPGRGERAGKHRHALRPVTGGERRQQTADVGL